MIKILMFHKVTEAAWFDQVICYLKTKYKILSINELQEYLLVKPKYKNAVYLTVDDGDLSFYKNIFPVLLKHKLPSSIFVSPKICKDGTNFWFQEIYGYDTRKLQNVISTTLNIPAEIVGTVEPLSILLCLTLEQILEIITRYQKLTSTPAKKGQNMTIDQLLEVYNSGLVSIGAHTLNHPILANETAETSNSEITESINELSSILNHEIKTFAYPNGNPFMDFSEREIHFLHRNKITCSFSTEPKNYSNSSNPMKIPRFGISYGSINFIKAKLFLGAQWQIAKNILSRSEAQERRKWKQLSNQYQTTC